MLLEHMLVATQGRGVLLAGSVSATAVLPKDHLHLGDVQVQHNSPQCT